MTITNNDSEIVKWIHYIFGLLYLPPDEVGDAFAEDLMSIMPVNEKLTNLADYLVNTYISEDATFPPQIWAALTSSTSRTTNNCEAFHSVFKKYCETPHPNINKFLDCLIGMQTDTYAKINSCLRLEKHITRTKTVPKQKFI